MYVDHATLLILLELISVAKQDGKSNRKFLVYYTRFCFTILMNRSNENVTDVMDQFGGSAHLECLFLI